MNKYEAMFIVKPDLTEEDRKAIFNQINDVVNKNNGKVLSADIWSEKKKFFFRIKKYNEGLYYLMSFNIASTAIKEIRQAFGLNENILRVLITRPS